ncbi:hypothetical protein XcfCFBP6990P_04910 [Xanthomonas citri pv. phaseoli var. fuscans]|nr:hypothetical protein XcfCFBP6988P_08035 [Xanthomonas citri pv. phaseoli var. fuscans]ATS43121.2 hypothetical protein XcfCFBP6989P_12440 [Xanthomonas citri pv. phaseoli var. fuscans]ATS46075.2 hypothetical protein XcfCFBP6990P_04910 [Xanthomonas citri pv. phaseoli var. fuscans]ATS83666.2 hypothetical protein XcfCFBP6991P_06550 [Xanthomonas citri pv. phaseoli var. fuscans]
MNTIATTTTNLLEPQLIFAREGHGLACVPDIAVTNDISEGRLVEVLNQFTEGGYIFRLIWPANRHRAPKLRVFIDFITNELSDPSVIQPKRVEFRPSVR